MSLLILISLISISIATDSNTTLSLQCPVNPAFCMIDLLKLWEELRLKEIGAANVLLPVVYYSKNSIIELCESYSDTANNCMLATCHLDDSVANFVNRHFSFVCKKDSAMKNFARQECIATTVIESNCSGLINGEPKIGDEVSCLKLEGFLTCVESPLKTSCGNEEYEFVTKIVASYGCSPGIGTGTESSTTVSTENTAVSEKFEKLVKNYEEELSSLGTTFPNMEDKMTSFFEVHTENNFSNSRTTKFNENHEITTSNEFIKDKTNNNDVLESSGEMPEKHPMSITKLQKEFGTVTAGPDRMTTNYNAENMTDCYTSIVGDFGRYLHSSPTASFVRFPLFGIKPMELEVLCAKFEVATKCVKNFCVGNCRLPPIKSFVDSQLKETCMLKEIPGFVVEFTCLQNVLKENTECIRFLNSSNPNRCDGHPQFRSCIVNRLLEDCSEIAANLMERMQYGFGCKILGEEEHEEQIDGSGETVEGSGSGDILQLNEKKQEESKNNVYENTITDELLTGEIKREPRKCEGDLKTAALSCLSPLLRLWAGINENRKDTEVVFPIFEFSRIELLELCDAFANYRNCARHKNSSICKSEPVISFAEEHFGQICTTQQIEASMKTHDCINLINMKEMAICQKFSRGGTLPGKRKCSKVRRYTKCVRKLVTKSCGHLLLAQFDMIVHRFGC